MFREDGALFLTATIDGVDSGALCQSIRARGRVNPVLISDVFDLPALREAFFDAADRDGVGQLIDMAVTKGRSTKADLECGICGEFCPTHAIDLSIMGRKAFRILVVDDESIIRNSLDAWLGDEEGYLVEMAASGPEALEKIVAEKCHLMLLDIKMPGMDGVTVLEKASPNRIRLTLLKIGAVIIRNTRRIRILMSSACPHQDLFRTVVYQLNSS